MFGGMNRPQQDGEAPSQDASTDNQPPTFDGSEQESDSDAEESSTTETRPQPPTLGGMFGAMFGGMFGGLWGNNHLEGEEMFSSNNFVTKNDLEGITDMRDTNIAGNFNTQSLFGNLDRGGMMSEMFGGGQFSQDRQSMQSQSK